MKTATTDPDLIHAYILALNGVPVSAWPAELVSKLAMKLSLKQLAP